MKMKKNIFGLLAIVTLAFPNSVIAYGQEDMSTNTESSVQSSEENVMSRSSEESDSSDILDESTSETITSPSYENEETSTTVSVEQTSPSTTTSVENSLETESSEDQAAIILPYFGEDEYGSYSVPRNRSDINPEVLSRATTPAVSADTLATPTKSFVDISSHNGNVSIEDFKIMKQYGVKGVVIKLTEYTTYINNFARVQINNAKAAGLQVSAYHYSWFKTDADARKEAEYFANAAKSFGLDSSTVMVNDMEEPQIAGKGDHTQNSLAFQKRLNELGYGNVRHYVGLYWLNSGLINASKLGQKNLWVAAYPYSVSKNNYYTSYGAWQWNDKLSFPGVNGSFDISADYTNVYSSNESLIDYSSHVMNIGWQVAAANNQVSGTVGQAKRIEAIKLSLVNTSNGGIEYQTHIQDIGWEKNWKANGQISGTTGQKKQIEALRIRLTGAMAAKYDIYYRVHTERFGWLNWAKNGAQAGTQGFGYELEAYQIRLVPKGESAPTGSGNSFVIYQDLAIQYQAHIREKGWQEYVMNGKIAGTTGQALPIEALEMKVGSNPLSLSGGIDYQAHVAKEGWQNWKSDNAISGTVGKALQAEAIRIKLNGNLATHYDIYYRVHSASYGWLGWAKNGEAAGTERLAKGMEAIEVRIVKKHGIAPSSSTAAFLKG